MKTYITVLLCCCFTILGFSQSITQIEYFYNTDPGFGNATQITANANSGTLTQTLSLAVPNTLSGFNTLYVRTKDDANVWSLYNSNTFYIAEDNSGNAATNLTAAEYFINTDPGFGNGDAIAINANTGSLNQTLSLPLANTLEGFNTLYIRTQDNNGIWSLYDSKIFYISADLSGAVATNIVAAEYFVNTDPGFGNASAIAVNANSGSITQTLALSISNTLNGFNTLYIRTQDDLGVWSLYDKSLFYIYEEQVISPIVAAEYFYDTDPGFGNGTAGTIVATGNPDEYTIDLSTLDVLPCDLHDFYIRLQNQDGSWSLYDYGLDVDVYDNADPTIVVFANITAELDANGQVSINIDDVNNGTFDDCELVSVVLDQAQFDYTCADLGTNTVTVTATDAEAKVSTLDVTITVVDNIDPVAISQNITVQLEANGTVSFTADDIDNSSTDNCSITNKSLDITSFNCGDLGANTVMLTVQDASGNSNTISATVTVEDSVNPVAISQNITVQLDANGNATIVADDIDNLSSDNCEIASKLLDITSFDCTNLGVNTVMLTVTDSSGNTNTTSATVTVEDSANPIVITQDITVQLDVNGTASIVVNDIENGSTDNCTISNSSLDITSFDCSDLGSNTVILSVTDQSGNIGTQTATVTVEDSLNPVAISQDITVQLDANGTATFTADDVDNNSTDNCAINTKSLDITSFDCSDVGANTVMLTVVDSSGNSNTVAAIVTVVDNLAPTAIALASITIQLDANGQASIDYTDVDNGSTDNCAIATLEVLPNTFSCSELGSNTVVFHAYDDAGNTDTVNVTVIVEDAINPVAISQDITVQLDANGNATIVADDIDNNSTDNCAISNKSLDITSFDCSNLGANTVMLTVSDATGNSDTISATVTVVDNINPTVLGQDITLDLNGNTEVTIVAADVNNGSNDNCGFTLSIDVDTFTVVGEYPVVLTITDAAGNSYSVTVTVTITDTLSVADFDFGKQIKVYPNPTFGNFNIEIQNLDQDANLEIYDLLGKQIQTVIINDSTTQLDISSYANGVYFLRFISDGKVTTKRIIKK